ncbi:MAG: metalloregulator ArsR/SmtB family transcription factor [Rhodospirillales bacterium]|nr:metalloregulator ArsR/SmtB family transcription factor [Rhodospirillales bacterium]
MNPALNPDQSPPTSAVGCRFENVNLPLEGLAFASHILRILDNPSRLMLLGYLVGGEKSVGELVALLGTNRSSVARHMSMLRRHGFISPRRSGARMFYSLNSPRGKEARLMLETLNKLGFDFPGIESQLKG